MWDTLLLMALALVVFGPRRLPKIGRQLGKLMYEFRKASNDFKFQMEEELRNAEDADRRKKEEEERQRALAAAPPPAQIETTASQVPALPSTTLESGAPALTESPYSEGTDPYIEAKATHPEEPAPTAADLTATAVETDSAKPPEPVNPIESRHLHIQPPSTGETVAAEHPNKVTESASPDAERSEPAAHHG